MIHISLQPSLALRLTTALLLLVWDGIAARQPLTKASLSSSRGRPPLSQKFSNCVQHLLAALLHIFKPVANNTKTSLIENWRTTLLQFEHENLPSTAGLLVNRSRATPSKRIGCRYAATSTFSSAHGQAFMLCETWYELSRCKFWVSRIDKARDAA